MTIGITFNNKFLILSLSNIYFVFNQFSKINTKGNNATAIYAHCLHSKSNIQITVYNIPFFFPTTFPSNNSKTIAVAQRANPNVIESYEMDPACCKVIGSDATKYNNK